MANKSFNARHGISVGPTNIEFIDATGQILAGTRISFLTNPTITTDQPLFNATQTWNNAATPFNALKVNITDTASNASSRLLDLQKGGVSQFYVDKSGNVVVLGDLTVQGTTVTMNTAQVDVEDINITLGNVTTPTDVTADGGGITLRGATNKTLIWDSANTNWTSSEHFNLATGKVFKINNVQVLSNTALGSTVVSSSLTSVGTIGTGVWQGTPIANLYIANPQVTVGTTTIALGASSTTLAGLTSVTSTSFVGALSGNASSASTVALTADNTTNATRYPLFASAATGNLSPLTDTGFTYNPSTGLLTSVSFSGSGASLTSLNASNLASGTVPDARISGSYTGMTNLTGTGTVDFAKFLGNAADTVSAPSFSWTGDTTTGIYRPAASQVAITIAGTQRGLFSAAGLSITGDIYASNAISLLDAGASIQMDTLGISGTRIKKITVNDGGGNWNFRGGVYFSGGLKYETTGNGAASQTFNFESQNGSIVWTVFATGTAGAAATASTTLSLDQSGLGISGGNFIGALTGNASTATTLQTARTINGVSFNGSANIVITADPNAHNQAWSTITSTPTTIAGYGITDAPTKTGTGASGTWGISVTGNAATATTLQTARTINGVSFDGSANITVEDSTKLPLAGGTMTGNIIWGTADRDKSVMGTYDSTKTQQIWSMGASYLNSATGVNFGNLYGAAYKHTNNTTGGTMAAGHQFVWCQNGVGTAALGTDIWTSGNVTAYSDRRVKTNIKVIDNAVARVMKLSGYTYDRIDSVVDSEGNRNVPLRQTGVIAQEVLEVLPEAVVGTEDTHYSVAYGNMVGLLIEAIKELKAEIEQLKGNV